MSGPASSLLLCADGFVFFYLDCEVTDKEERKRGLPAASSLLKRLQELGLRPVEARSPEHHHGLPPECQGPSHLNGHLLPPSTGQQSAGQNAEQPGPELGALTPQPPHVVP